MADEIPPPMSPSFLVMALGRRLRDIAEEHLRTTGIAVRHLSALGHLSRDPGLSYSELARRAGLTPQSMQATLRSLEQIGAVHRETDAGRGRTARLFVTDIGRELLRSGRSVYAELDVVVREHLSETAVAELSQAFPALTRALDDMGGP
ncbi:MarR family transcriptional regulator [uncultured Williamsia sp.]|uniref:MarR family winged helix-turn-helix transcriptional regulator n=1 Tax=uncultured Williamsia sp. TaxID=259311 RepID=UPI0026389EB3|nr:MarR family transcriptional regulator [uncultured Williamsia sp.]